VSSAGGGHSLPINLWYSIGEDIGGIMINILKELYFKVKAYIEVKKVSKKCQEEDPYIYK
jgi:hypothetical protein